MGFGVLTQGRTISQYSSPSVANAGRKQAIFLTQKHRQLKTLNPSSERSIAQVTIDFHCFFSTFETARKDPTAPVQSGTQDIVLLRIELCDAKE